MAPVSVTLLTNFVPPYLVSFFAALRERVGRLSLVVSTRMEENRPWVFQGEGLPVRVQRTLTLRQRWRHPTGFSEAMYLHLPLDTLSILYRDRPDVIVTTEFGLRTLQAVAYSALRRRTRIVLWALVSEATEQGRGWLRCAVRRWLLRRVDAVVVSGESGARYVAGLGFPDAAIFRVPPYATVLGASPSPSDRTGPGSRRLLYVGQLIERKGLAGFLGAVACWGEAHPGERLELWIVGDGPERSDLERRELPANVAVRFCGNVSYADLPDYYARAGILVFPTLADEWGVVVNEAMAAGLPVLGSLRSQAVEDLVETGSTGWTFEPEEPGEALAALSRALATPAAELDCMRRRCVERVQRFQPERAVIGMLEAIDCASAGSAHAGNRR